MSFARRFIIKYRSRRCHFFIFFLIVVFLTITFHFKNLFNTVIDNYQLEELSKIYEPQVKAFENKFIPNLGNNGKVDLKNVELDPKEVEEAQKIYALNSVLSDLIPLNRTLYDARDSRCRSLTYDNINIKASVVLIFYNEIPSVIFRTVWSIINQSPPHLLEEIILVDDASTNENLKGFLDYYVKTRLKNYKIKVTHRETQGGLIVARLTGANMAEGDVIIFLDAHCEANVGWLEPLLHRIQEDNTAVLVPLIDGIQDNTFQYFGGGSVNVGTFDWSGFFRWKTPPEKYKNTIEPIPSATMAGGLFAVHREFFFKIGSYDDKMTGWGGENIDISFRTWMCGGRLETIPCSRVGHVFRKVLPYRHVIPSTSFLINSARVAMVWLDEYKKYYFETHPDINETDPRIGDLSERFEIKNQLKCKPFKWYLENITPDKFIPDINCQGYGQFRNAQKAVCLDNLQIDFFAAGPLGVYPCHKIAGTSQKFTLTLKNELRNEFKCALSNDGRNVIFKFCNDSQEEHQWFYFKNLTIFHRGFSKCLSTNMDKNEKGAVLETCNGSAYQTWEATYLNFTSLS